MAKEIQYEPATQGQGQAQSGNQHLVASQQQKVVTPVATKTMNHKTLQAIKKKAESNAPLVNQSKEAQNAYKMYQDHFSQLVVQRARDGGRLHNPNEWKNALYEEARGTLNVNDKAYYNSDNVMMRQEKNSDEYAAKQGEFLSGSRDAYMDTQGAMLGKARDQQLADVQKALEDAVTEGNISVREAEAAFEEQKATIETEGYNDSERTKVAMGARGIQNSAQSMGMEASDNSRRVSMINKNMTERDGRVATIKDRVNAIKNKSAIDSGMANANYNYGMAGAQGQADMQYNQQMYDMTSQENNMTRNQQFQLDSQGMSNAQQEKMAGLAQTYTLEQFAVQQGYNIDNMSIQQQNQLAQMYQGHIYGMAMQDDAQNFQGGQNSLDRNQQRWLQNDAQSFQGSENSLDRGQQRWLQNDAQGFQGHQNSLDRGQQRWLQNDAQGFQGNQNSLDRSHQSNLQNDAQSFQGGQNSLDRSHQSGLQNNSQSWQSGESSAQRSWQSDENSKDRKATQSNMQTQLDAQAAAANSTVDEYGTALNRELAKYDPTTPEGKLKSYQVKEAEKLMVTEFQTKTELDIISQRIAKGGVPEDPGKKPTLKSMMTGYERFRTGMAKTGIGISEKDLKKKYEKKYAEQLKLWEKASAEYKSYNAMIGKK